MGTTKSAKTAKLYLNLIYKKLLRVFAFQYISVNSVLDENHIMAWFPRFSALQNVTSIMKLRGNRYFELLCIFHTVAVQSKAYLYLFLSSSYDLSVIFFLKIVFFWLNSNMELLKINVFNYLIIFNTHENSIIIICDI